jgi:hypothetical protein
VCDRGILRAEEGDIRQVTAGLTCKPAAFFGTDRDWSYGRIKDDRPLSIAKSVSITGGGGGGGILIGRARAPIAVSVANWKMTNKEAKWRFLRF